MCIRDRSSFWHYEDDFIYLIERIPVNSLSGNSMLISKIDKKILQYELDGDSLDEGVVIDVYKRQIVDDTIATIYVNGVALNARMYQKPGESLAFNVTDGRLKIKNVTIARGLKD